MGKKKVSAEVNGRKRAAESGEKPARKARKGETPGGCKAPGVSGPSSRVSGRDRGGAQKLSPRPRGVQLLFAGLGFEPPESKPSDAEGGGTGGGTKKRAPKAPRSRLESVRERLREETRLGTRAAFLETLREFARACHWVGLPKLSFELEELVRSERLKTASVERVGLSPVSFTFKLARPVHSVGPSELEEPEKS